MNKQILTLVFITLGLSQSMLAMEPFQHSYVLTKITLPEAAKAGNVSTLATLISQGANVNEQDNKGNTALSFAAGMGHKECCELLLAHNADIERGSRLFTPLGQALVTEHHETSKLLLESGAALTKADIAFRLTCNDAEGCRICLIHATFTPRLSQKQFQESRDHIFTALLIFKRFCPRLPKDVRKLILYGYEQESKQDAENAAIFGHYKKAKEEDALQVPLPLIRLFIHNKTWDAQKTVKILKAHHCQQASQLLHKAYRDVGDLPRGIYIPGSKFEDKFGTDIEQNICKRLGIVQEIEEVHSESTCIGQ